jgi:hypothetical protein
MDGLGRAVGLSVMLLLRARPIIIRLRLHFWTTITVTGALTIRNLVLDTMII